MGALLDKLTGRTRTEPKVISGDEATLSSVAQHEDAVVRPTEEQANAFLEQQAALQSKSAATAR